MFLAGDAAHLMPPNGGFGGNTGIHDAHNLAWKLALVLKDVAGPELLSTYETERKPVGKFTVEQAYTRYVTRTATYLGAKDFEPLAQRFQHRARLSVSFARHRVRKAADTKDMTIRARRHGRPGSRAPHVWLERGGKKISSLDLIGTHFVLLAAAQGQAWCDAAREAAKAFKGVDLDAYCIGGDIKDPDGRFPQAYGVEPSGAVLVRPDGFVGWRATSLGGNPRQTIEAALRSILQRT